MNTHNMYMKIRKNTKALSPVVASIILIAVTVAVSVAVAAWMGGMTIGFMGSSSITITAVDFSTADQIELTLKNTGTKTVTIAAVRINNQVLASDLLTGTDWTKGDLASTTPDYALAAGENATLLITDALAHWQNGNPYKIDLYDGSNQVIGSTQQNAPGA